MSPCPAHTCVLASPPPPAARRRLRRLVARRSAAHGARDRYGAAQALPGRLPRTRDGGRTNGPRSLLARSRSGRGEGRAREPRRARTSRRPRRRPPHAGTRLPCDRVCARASAARCGRRSDAERRADARGAPSGASSRRRACRRRRARQLLLRASRARIEDCRGDASSGRDRGGGEVSRECACGLARGANALRSRPVRPRGWSCICRNGGASP
jgi:hypothetical protein